MLSRSTAEITASSGTLVNNAILRRSPSGNGRSLRQIRMSGWMPIERSSFTECCVGLVFISPADAMSGTSVRWMNSVRRLPYIVRSAYAGFQQTSVTLEEASANLGASPFRTLRKITLPLVTANLIAGTILTFSFAMLEVSDGLILAMKEDYFPITKMIYQLMGRIDPNAPSVACAGRSTTDQCG